MNIIHNLTIEHIDLNKLKVIAAKISSWVEAGTSIFLWGDLGAGKTTFSRFLIQSLTPEITHVPSPTFTLVEVYDTPKGEVWHCDLYRLKQAYEVLELGLEEAFYDCICLVEWPERLGNFLPLRRLDIYFKMGQNNNRCLTFKLSGLPNVSIPNL